ncbi:MAG TPA: recombinase family protein [Bradyrhizobium sp.]|nr:recombinase family protein [Bradyrhizobium sp.]
MSGSHRIPPRTAPAAGGQWRAAVTENTRGHVSLTEQMDTTTPQGEFLFHVFDALAQFERSRGTDHCRPRPARRRGRQSDALS